MTVYIKLLKKCRCKHFLTARHKITPDGFIYD